jgi:hypothetical protein
MKIREMRWRRAPAEGDRVNLKLISNNVNNKILQVAPKVHSQSSEVHSHNTLSESHSIES